MPNIKLLTPLDQPTNSLRLLNVLQDSLLEESSFTCIRFIVAYAKSGILKKLEPYLIQWSKRSADSAVFVGIDQKVTSKEALEKSISLFDQVFIINHKSVTFHPKVYLFKNAHKGRIIIGSNNLTVGGLESNFESAVIIDYDFAVQDDSTAFHEFWSSTDNLLSEGNGISAPVTKELIDKLFSEDLLAVETQIPGVVSSETKFQKRSQLLDEIFSSNFSIKASQSSSSTVNVEPKNASETPKIQESNTADISEVKDDSQSANVDQNHFETLLIQIKPHHNGEIFLSKLAVNERPAFFGFPFTGQTIPKKASNSSYPQREPDPIVNILVYGSNFTELLKLENYPLNTVSYETRSEIRITCSQLVGIVPEYSLMIMSKPISDDDNEFDYQMVIHTPESPSYDEWVAKCGKKMPGGGKLPRVYGWL